MKISVCLFALAPVAVCTSISAAQIGGHMTGPQIFSYKGFGPRQLITTKCKFARSVFATDLDGDGDADVLSASEANDEIAWYKNRLNAPKQDFGPPQVITTSANSATSVYATDLDGDGDADVLSASRYPPHIAWYENQGGGVFGAQQAITTSAQFAQSVYATDLDGDGDADVLSASNGDNKIAWYENQGGGVFGPQQVITTSATGAQSVYATDLDGDGDADILSASRWDDKIAWYENQGGGVFGPQQVITTSADAAMCVYATDLDGDGDADVLSASQYDDKIAWYENQGGGVFGPQQTITTSAIFAKSVYATDMDGDGDADVLSASFWDWKIAWYENLGGGVFGGQQTITQAASQAISVYATDLNGDGRADVLSASYKDYEIAWHENLIPNDCNGNGVPDYQEIAGDPSLDWNGDGVLDACSSPNYCQSTGAVMAASGSPLMVDNDFTLLASSLPLNEWGYFLMSGSKGFIPGFGGSMGTLCLGPPIYRFVKPPSGQVLNSGPAGQFVFKTDLNNLPQGVVFTVGSSWHFQAWFREASSSNTTDGIEVMFR